MKFLVPIQFTTRPMNVLFGIFVTTRWFSKLSMLFRTALFLLLIGGITFSGSAQSIFYHTAKNKWLDTEGLYYLDAKQNHQDIWAFVITLHGKQFPPKKMILMHRRNLGSTLVRSIFDSSNTR